MDEDSSDQQASAEVTPASSENDLLANKSEDSLDDDEDEDDNDDIDKMLNELQSFREVCLVDNISLFSWPTSTLANCLLHYGHC